MSGFFEEVKRRKVYRVAVAYAVAAGGIIQLASAAFPAWELPNWALRLVIVLLLIGFPIALILAWAFDVTPEGIRATPQLPAASRRKRNLIALIAIGVFVSAVGGFFLLPRASARKLDKSIAVLPFESYSTDQENAFFADGIQDDILTNLAKIGDLKVISRTSVMAYRGKQSSAREIGKTLGVSSVLEGSVRRAGNQVRVTVQLIDTATDEHVWAENYEGDLTNVFAIQSELAQKIAGALHAKLSPAEMVQMKRKPTENAEAFLVLGQARSLFVAEEIDKLKESERLVQRAIELDPNFALALAYYSHLESWIFHTFEAEAVRKLKARELAETSLRLQPDLPEGHLALGYCYYYGDLDYDRALKEFEIARNGLPNNAEVLLAVGAIKRRQGKWEESTASFERAVELNPKDPWMPQNLAVNYVALRRFEEAEKVFDIALALAPGSVGLRSMKSQMALLWKGDLSVGETQLAAAPPGFDPAGMVTQGRVGYLIYRRKYAEALALIQKIPGDTVHGENGTLASRRGWEGTLYWFLGEKEKSAAANEEARVYLEDLVRKTPNEPNLHNQLGLTYAMLGRREDAIREGKRAVELLPESKDAYDGPVVSLGLAQIYVWTGDNDEALALLEKSLQTPNGTTVPMLKLDVVYDPLRSDPRFAALLEKYAPKS